MKKIVILFLLIGTTQVLNAQIPISKLELDTMIQLEVNKQISKKLPTDWTEILGLSALGLGVATALFFMLKSTLSKILENQIEKEVEKRIGNMVGVKVDLVKEYFADIVAEKELKKKRILVVNLNTGKKTSIETALKNAGFSTLPIFKTMAEIDNGLNTNDFDLLLFDNEDNQLSITQMTTVIDRYQNALKFTCFTSQDWDNNSFLNYRSKIRFAKQPNYIGDAVTASLKS
jgi:hypothetical protein